MVEFQTNQTKTLSVASFRKQRHVPREHPVRHDLCRRSEDRVLRGGGVERNICQQQRPGFHGRFARMRGPQVPETQEQTCTLPIADGRSEGRQKS